MEQIRIAVSGSNGFVGRNLRRFLSEKKIPVTTLARKKHKQFRLEKRIVFSNLVEKNLAGKLKGCTALIHLIGTGVQTASSDYDLVNVDITNNMISLCKKSKIKKIVYISGLGVHPSTTFGYFISKLRAERQIIRSGLDYTILRASYIIGKDDPLTKNLARQANHGAIIIPGTGSYRLQPISVVDVSKIILECVINKKLSNKIVDLVGPKTVTFASLANRFAKNKGVKVKKISLEKAYYDALNRPSTAAYGLDDLNILVGDYTGNYEKLARLCGFKIRAPVL
ncbi:MAG: NAD(P)H-binding protein [Candidatus Nitrosotenuis sp.]|nr:NAD(P)H-binding protein [Candidatus Nitrosotenuis sp.]